MNKKHKHQLKKAWKFFWDSDSTLSWVLNLVVAFIVIKFLVYPGLGLALGTDFPIVAVVSESMEHGLHQDVICGQSFPEFDASFDNWWDLCGSWYQNIGITKNQFQSFPLKNGFDKGDVIILWRADKVNVGDVLIFQAYRTQPIIHRVVKVHSDGTYQTKGDHNSNSIVNGLEETSINHNRVYGKGLLRVPYLGWVKILFVDLMQVFGVNIVR
jgi:signal peptidase I